jgi:hypothetical protein
VLSLGKKREKEIEMFPEKRKKNLIKKKINPTLYYWCFTHILICVIFFNHSLSGCGLLNGDCST